MATAAAVPDSSGKVQLTLTPSTRRAKPGQPVSVDVFLEGTSDVRLYQLTIEVNGGGSGQLELQDVTINSSRSDYVFAEQSPVSIPDTRQRRVVSALWEGGVSTAGEPRYLATFRFVPSRDAKGAFRLQLSAEPATMLRDSQRRLIEVERASGTVITVGRHRVLRAR